MYLNAFRIRLSLMAAGLIVVGIFIMMGGSLGLDRKTAIIIHFGIEPQEFTGCEVMIDSVLVGRLQPVGRTYQNGFKVPAGEHLVELIHPEYRCLPTQVTTVRGASGAHLRVDFDSHRLSTGKYETVIYLEGGRRVIG
jgi:hypothetical protein